MTKNLLLISCIFLLASASAQHMQYEASNKLGGSTYDHIVDMTIDEYGNVYTSSRVEGNCILSYPNNSDTLISPGLTDMIITKSNKDGSLIWSRQFGGTGFDQAFSIQVDIDDNLLITGDFSNTVDFDPEVGIVSLSSTGSGQDGFILKLDTAGNYISVQQVICTNRAVVVDAVSNSSGDLYVTGFFKGTADFDLGPGSDLSSSVSGNADSFFNKYTSTGALIWSRVFETNLWGGGPYISLNAVEQPLIYGQFNNTMDVDPSPNQYLLSGAFGARYTIQYDNAGGLIWAESIANSTSSYAFGPVYFDGVGDLISVGRFKDSVDFDPSPAVNYLTGASQGSLFIRKQDMNGSLLWVKEVVNATGASIGSSLTDDGEILVTGTFSGQVDFDPGAGIALTGSSTGVENLFVLKLDSAGNFIWVIDYEGQGSSDGIRIFANGKSIVVGVQVRGTLDVNHGSGIVNLASTGSVDIDVVHIHLSECQSEIDTIVCGTSFTSPSGNHLWTSSGVYVDTISDAFGCGGPITVNLVLDSADTSVTSNATGSMLTANASGGAYQWLDCDQGYAAIPGATSQIFNPNSAGSYAVQVVQNGCTDTSSCSISTVGIDQLEWGDFLTPVPNPTSGILSLHTSGSQKIVSVRVRNALGQLIATHSFKQEQQVEFELRGEVGLYFLIVAGNLGEERVLRVLKY